MGRHGGGLTRTRPTAFAPTCSEPIRPLGLRMAYCLALCAAAMAVAAAPCLADDVTKTDEVGDVRFYEIPNGPGGPLVGFDVPVHRNGDLRRAYVRYGEKRIRVVMRFRELRRREPVLGVQGRLRWPARGQFDYGEAVIGSPRWIQFNASTFTADDDVTRRTSTSTASTPSSTRTTTVRSRASPDAYSTGEAVCRT